MWRQNMWRNQEHHLIPLMRPLPILKDLSDDGDRGETRHSRNRLRIDVTEQSSEHNRIAVSNPQFGIHSSIREHRIAADEPFDRTVFRVHLRRHAAIAADGRSQPQLHAYVHELNLLST